MTDRETAERVHDLLRLADRLRVPGHRHTVEAFLGQVGELRLGLIHLHRDLTRSEMPHERRRPTRSEFPEISSAAGRVAVQFRGRPKRAASA